MDFSKKNLEHCGTQHIPSKSVGLFRKRIKLTKVAIVSDVKFNFESKVCYGIISHLFFEISVAKVTILSQNHTFFVDKMCFNNFLWSKILKIKDQMSIFYLILIKKCYFYQNQIKNLPLLVYFLRNQLPKQAFHTIMIV